MDHPTGRHGAGRKSSITIILFLAAISLFLPGCCGPAGTFGDGNGSKALAGNLHGTVTDANGTPLDGVSVSLLGDEFSDGGRTGKDGTYDIAGVPAGTYGIVVGKEGYDSEVFWNFTIIEGYSYRRDVVLKAAGSPDASGPRATATGSLHGTVKNMMNVSVGSVSILLIGGNSSYNASTDKDGKYNFSDVAEGAYSVAVGKQWYRGYSANISILAGHTYAWNLTIARDCAYYPVNTSMNYVLRYGYNGTLYRGDVSYAVEYPAGAKYTVFPAEDGSLSMLYTSYLAGNRMLRWKLDNLEGRYSYVQAYIHMDMNGTQEMRLFGRKGTAIEEAARSQPAFLGSEVSGDKGKRVMIDPSNREIKAIAWQVKGETNDTWAVAQALFVWLKNNTAYYHGPESDTYTQSAIEVLHSRRGDCDELSTLYISLCRAAGIPARFVKGYLVQKEPKKYSSHEWVEFFDDGWVPVEVASSGNQTYNNGVILGETGNLTHMVDLHFGVDAPDHVRTFVDDGSSQSLILINEGGTYFDKPSAFSNYVFYDAIGYNKGYIASCSDGTRKLVEERE